jgi:hypothetical protein
LSSTRARVLEARAVADFFIFESFSAECSRVCGGVQNPPLFNRKTAR